MKMKQKPSAKIKRRYILLSASSKHEIEKAILDYIGIIGWAKAAPFFVENKDNKIILAVERSSLNNVRAALEISPYKIKILKVSGTLKGISAL